MKKFLWLVVILFSVAASAEDVQLVTVLPSPVGSFVRLDTASTKKKAEFTSVQFGNENAAGGEIELVGGSTSSVYKITLDQGTTLKSNDETLANMTKADVVVTVQGRSEKLMVEDLNAVVLTLTILLPITSILVW